MIAKKPISNYPAFPALKEYVTHDSPHWPAITHWIKSLALAHGFSDVGISDPQLHDTEVEYQQWLDKGFHGEMDYMAKHGHKRTRPEELVPGTTRIINVRMNYLPPNAHQAESVLTNPNKAYISRYALGRDYHKIMRQRLQALCEVIQTQLSALAFDFAYRVFTDSAPVMEVALAEKAGLGWRGKHTLLLSRQAGSWFFLGEIYTNLPLIADNATSAHCGSCQACIDVCPTQAIVAPYEVDARKCISYLTIELKGSIPEPLRPLIGNRIYGCDDCQLVCPWNKYAKLTLEPDFFVRAGLDNTALTTLFLWNETTFKDTMAGSAIYRIGYHQWLRNIAVGLGNAPSSPEVIHALESRINHENAMVREHVTWALAQHTRSKEG